METSDWRTPEAQLGRRLAAGRDGTIHESGKCRVLRRLPEERDLLVEAQVMEHARTCGYPVPEVFRVGRGEMEIERIEGRTMLDDLQRTPLRARRHGRVLADLHRRLHALALPATLDLPTPFGPGESLLHRDLHPANVILSPKGPVVIDWTNVSRGPGVADVADTWIVLACAQSDVPLVLRLAERPIRAALRRGFLDGIDVDAVRAELDVAALLRLADPNMRPAERAAIERFVRRETRTANRPLDLGG